MAEFVTYKTREIITVNPASSTRLGGGGEGVVYAVANRDDLAVKLFVDCDIRLVNDPKIAKLMREKEPKLHEMLTKPPENAYIAWPQDVLYMRPANVFAGYVMRKVSGAKFLPILYTPEHRLQKLSSVTHKLLLHVARNVAAVFHSIHGAGYVVGDVNDGNTLVRPDGTPFQIDTDSFQVGKHYCRTFVPEFTPPELQTVNLGETYREPYHDSFGLAVLIHKTLLDAAHPFLGIIDTEDQPTLGQRIHRGLCPYRQNSNPICRPSPAALPVSILHPELQELFRRCFSDGHSRPHSRPTPLEWLKCLDEALKRLTQCPRNPNHSYSSHLYSCPWCELIRLGKGERFPKSWTVKTECFHGRIDREPDTGILKHGAKIRLKVIPYEGYYFSGWTDKALGKANPIVITAESDVTVTARCEAIPQWKLAVDARNGTLYCSPEQTLYKDQTVINLSFEADEGYKFIGWEGTIRATTADLEFAIGQDTVLIAKCVLLPTWRLTTAASHGTISRGPDLPVYKELSPVTLTAIPSKGFRFVSWEGISQTNQNPVTIALSQDTHVAALFEVRPFELKLHSPGGHIELGPNRTSFYRGETVTLRAVPRKGYKFVGWTPESMIGNPAGLTVIDDMDIYAKFEAHPPNLWAFEAGLCAFISVAVFGLRFLPDSWLQFFELNPHSINILVFACVTITLVVSGSSLYIANKRDGDGRSVSVWGIVIAVLTAGVQAIWK